MADKELLEKNAELSAEITTLPKGYISQKTSRARSTIIINGQKTVKSRASICEMMRLNLLPSR